MPPRLNPGGDRIRLVVSGGNLRDEADIAICESQARNSAASKVGKLDKAAAKGWGVVDMKQDWKAMFQRHARLIKEGDEVWNGGDEMVGRIFR